MSAETQRSLATWLGKHCCIQEDGHDRYLRLRVGRGLGSAAQVWRTKGYLAGMDANVLASEIWDRYSRVTAPDRAWVEVMRVGGKGSEDWLPLGSGSDDEGGQGGQGGDLDMTPAAMLSLAVNALVTTNAQLQSQVASKDALIVEIIQGRDELLDAKDQRVDNAMGKWITAVHEGEQATSMLKYIETFGVPGQESSMADIIGALGPDVGPAIQSAVMQWAAAGKQPASPGEPPAQWVAAVSELERLWAAHPDVLLSDAMTLGRLAMVGQGVQAAYAARQQPAATT